MVKLFKSIKFLFVLIFIILFSNFADAVDVTSCGNLTSANTIYVLQNDITTTETCLRVLAENVTIDLNGFEVTYGDDNSSSSFIGIYSAQNYTTVKNGSIRENLPFGTRYGIRFYSTNYGVIENINSSSNYYGIYLYNADNGIVRNIISNYNGNGLTLTEGTFNNDITNVTTKFNSGSGILLSTLLTATSWNSFTNITSSYNNGSGISMRNTHNNSFNYINASGNNQSGVNLESLSRNNNITNIIANSNSLDGITILCTVTVTCYFNYIENVTATSNTEEGIYLGSYSTKGTIKNVVLNSNGNYGLGFFNSASDYVVTNVTANYNANSGITVQKSSSDNNSFTDAITNGNSIRGVYVLTSTKNSFTNLTANSNPIGIYLNHSSNNTFINITANSNTDDGIHLWNVSTNNTFKNSRIENNSQYGIYLEHFTGNPQYNYFYNNVINNSVNYYNSTALTNYFNTTLTATLNIVGENYIGGNFWGYPNGTGFSDTCEDTDKNGICNLSYNLDGANYDYLPLNIPDRTAPTITLYGYANATVKNSSASLTLNISVTDAASDISTCLVNANGTNQTLTYSNGWYNSSSIYLTGLSEGNHTIKIYANDSAHNLALNNSYVIWIDDTIPDITKNSPENATYSTASIIFNITATDNSYINSCVYSLDGSSNVSLTNSAGNYWTKTSSVSENNHNVTFYCNDSANNFDSSTEYFVVDLPVTTESSGSTGGAGSTTASGIVSEVLPTILFSYGSITANQPIVSTINSPGLNLNKITITTNQNVSGTSLTVKGVSATDTNLLGGLTNKEVYQGFQVQKDGLTDDKIRNITFDFKIEKSWLEGKEISKVILQRKPDNSSEWQMLNTTLTTEDSTYYYFKAVSYGFSTFAIYFDSNLCVPGELFCSGDILKLCDANRNSTTIQNCEFGCSLGKCLEYWEPDEEESVIKRVTRLIFGTWLNFETIVFSIIVAIVSLSLILVSYLTFRYYKKLNQPKNKHKKK